MSTFKFSSSVYIFTSSLVLDAVVMVVVVALCVDSSSLVIGLISLSTVGSACFTPRYERVLFFFCFFFYAAFPAVSRSNDRFKCPPSFVSSALYDTARVLWDLLAVSITLSLSLFLFHPFFCTNNFISPISLQRNT